MSLNWVMLDSTTKDFVRLPHEKILFTSLPRMSFTLQSANTFPGKMPLNLKSESGKAFITNKRVLFLPSKPKPEFQSFQVPILSLQDTHVTAPWFGPNVWEGVVIPTAGGGIPPHHNYLQIRLIFKEGGAFDFSSIYERIKDVASQAAEVARENGRTVRGGGEIDLEQLPAYEETAAVGSHMPQPSQQQQQQAGATQQELAPITVSRDEAASGFIQRPTPISPTRSFNATADSSNRHQPESTHLSSQQSHPPPDGPPPGYDESLQDNSMVVRGLEENARESERPYPAT